MVLWKSQLKKRNLVACIKIDYGVKRKKGTKLTSPDGQDLPQTHQVRSWETGQGRFFLESCKGLRTTDCQYFILCSCFFPHFLIFFTISGQSGHTRMPCDGDKLTGVKGRLWWSKEVTRALAQCSSASLLSPPEEPFLTFCL